MAVRLPVVRNETRDRIVNLYEENYTLLEICRAIGWKSKARGNVTKVLRENGYRIPYLNKLGDKIPNLRKSDIESLAEND